MQRVFSLLAVMICASVLASEPANAIPTNWWSNRTSDSNVFDAGPFLPLFIGERPRLGAATTGFIEGTVALPSVEDWVLDFTVSFDGNIGSDLNDFVRVFLDGVLIGDFTNDAVSPVNYLFNDSSFDYRFEFTSSNTVIGFHQIVNAGTVEVAQVPEPASMVLFASGLAGMGIVVRRRRRKQ